MQPPATEKILRQFIDPNIMCVRCRSGKKEPSEIKVTYHSCASSYILDWVLSGGNVGATSLTGYAVFIDEDTERIRRAVHILADTLRWNSGKPLHTHSVLFLEDEPLQGSIPLIDGGYIKTMKGYVVIPPSIHPNGRRYGEEINDVPIASVIKKDLLTVVSPFIVSKNDSSRAVSEYNRFQEVNREQVNNLVEELVELWSKADGRRHDLVLAIVGLLERRGWNQGKIQALVDELIRQSGKGHEHSAQVRYAYGRGSHKWGLPMIKAIAKEVEDVH